MVVADFSGRKQERRARSFGYRLSTLLRMFRSSIQEEVEALGVKTCLIPFLSELFYEDGVPQEELAERLFLDKGSTARGIARLEADGLVYRIRNRDNRRQKLVYLTDKAVLLEAPFFAVLEKGTQRMTRGLSCAERETTLLLFDHMIANFRPEISKDDV